MIRQQQTSGLNPYGALGEYAGGMRWSARPERLGSAFACASRQTSTQFITSAPVAPVALPPLTSARTTRRGQPRYVQPPLPGMSPRATHRRADSADSMPASAAPATFATLVAPALTPADAPRACGSPRSSRRRAAKPASAESATMLDTSQSAPTTVKDTVKDTVKGGRKKISVRQRFGELRVALAEGWEIVQPIFARPLWSVADDSANAFNFVLQREHDTRLVIVPEGRTVTRFIRDRRLIVDYRR
ncbi:MAG: hypothetical protein ABI068_14020 [Ktedonobacterales bacterium]